jgi:hypothetical protein
MSISSSMIANFERDQRAAIQLMNHCTPLIQKGMSETDVIQLFESHVAEFGFEGFLRRPVVHFDHRPSFRWGPSSNRTLKKGAVVQLHIQPYSTDAFGNIGQSFTFEAPNIPIVDKARELCIATSTFAGHTKKSGELMVFAQSWATNHRTELDQESIGHFCFENSQSGLFGGVWPRSMRVLTQLRRYQIQWFNPRPLYGIYALHPDIRQDNRRLGFAEMILVTPEERRALGRNDMSELCTFTGVPTR